MDCVIEISIARELSMYVVHPLPFKMCTIAKNSFAKIAENYMISV